MDPSARDAVAEASTTLADAMKQCFAVGGGKDADGETLRRWLAGITGFGGDTASVDGAALLATAQRAAGALVAATSRAATAERAAEEAKEAVDQMCVDLDATRAERDAPRARRSTANGRRAADGKTRRRARSLARGVERRAQRIASDDRRGGQAIGSRRGRRGGEVEAAGGVGRAEKSQLGDVIRRLASRTLGRGKRRARRGTLPAPRAVRAGRATGENERAVLGKSRKSRFARFDDSARRSIGTTYS